MLLLLLVAELSHAGLSKAPQTAVRLRQNLALLERHCQAEEAKDQAVCDGAFKASSAECRHILDGFSAATAAAETKVKEAARWWAKRGAVQDDGKTVTITFDITSLPGYPYSGSDAITNEALQTSIASLDRIGAITKVLSKKRECRATVKDLRETWESERSGESLSDFHNDLGSDVSGMLLEGERALQAGAAEEAAAGLKEELPGVTVKPLR